VPHEISVLDPASPAISAYSCYRSLIETSGSTCSAEQGLAGRLLYAGELDAEGRAVAIAGNVAGCATLAATADPDAQKQAVRDGVVDFLVTSLDEALRILKNEIRKQSTVAVCIAQSIDSVEREMLERGVQPDLVRANALQQIHPADSESSGLKSEPMRSPATVVWGVKSLPAKWLPKLDAIALECLHPTDDWNRRWIQRSPRYLNKALSNLRVVRSDHEFAPNFIERLRSAIDRGEIGTAATLWVTSESGSEECNLQPAQQRSS